ncbi:MAG: hypothetical protein IJW10_02435 [Clostridia bacterium]|nr:hypothetical protein [Clostridia bacterium]
MKKSKVLDLVIFTMLGCILFMSKIITELLPNIHPVTMFICVYTLVYRARAIIPVYVFVAVSGLFYGFAPWWIPYLYIWAFAWALFMLIPKNASLKLKGILSTVFCALHGLLYGVLYAPAQAVLFGLNFKGMIAWIVAGIPFDILHMCGNIVISVLVIPLYKVVSRLEEKRTI